MNFQGRVHSLQMGLPIVMAGTDLPSNTIKEGYYFVKATARKENDEIGQDYTVFNIALKNKEFKDPP